MRAIRNAIPAEERGRLGVEIERRLFDLPALLAASTVLLFSSFGSEVPTDGIRERLIEQGHRVVLPYLDGREMEAAEVRPGEALTSSAYGPAEPPSRSAVDPRQIEAAVAPGLAFDRIGYRLGYGGGHFDRYLRRIGTGAVRIGIGFHVQLVDAVPHGLGDEPLDLVVTEDVTIDCRAARRGPG